jgi:hypothetical protein
MIWLLALQLALPPQQQHYNNAEAALARMQFGPADEEVDQALRVDPNFVPALLSLPTAPISPKAVSSRR